MPKTILEQLANEDDDQQIELRIDVKVTVEDMRKAILRGRAMKWSHERDGEWAELLATFLLEECGVGYDLDDARLMEAPAVLVADEHVDTRNTLKGGGSGK